MNATPLLHLIHFPHPLPPHLYSQLPSSSQVKAMSQEHFLLYPPLLSPAGECGHEDGTQISHTLAKPPTVHSTDSSTDGSQLASDSTVSQLSIQLIYRASYLCRPANQCQPSNRHPPHCLMLKVWHQKTEQINTNLPAVLKNTKAHQTVRSFNRFQVERDEGFCQILGLSMRRRTSLSVLFFRSLGSSNVVFYHKANKVSPHLKLVRTCLNTYTSQRDTP